MIFEEITVQCYSGYKGNEAPRSFVYRGRRYRIVDIVDRWYEGGREPGGIRLDYYKTRTDTEETFLIRYNGLFDRWALLVSAKKDRKNNE